MTALPTLFSRVYTAQHGFTLIELLATIMIMGLVIGGGVAGFSRFNDQQQVFQSGHNLQSILRAAQKKAMSGEKPAGCTTLKGYSVVGTSGAATYALNAVCSNNGAILDQTYTLPTGVSLYQNINLGYEALTGSILPLPPSPTPAFAGGFADIYIGNATTGYFSLRVDQGGTLSIPCAKLITTMTPSPVCPP